MMFYDVFMVFHGVFHPGHGKIHQKSPEKQTQEHQFHLCGRRCNP